MSEICCVCMQETENYFVLDFKQKPVVCWNCYNEHREIIREGAPFETYYQFIMLIKRNTDAISKLKKRR